MINFVRHKLLLSGRIHLEFALIIIFGFKCLHLFVSCYFFTFNLYKQIGNSKIIHHNLNVLNYLFKDYRLDFSFISSRWSGAVATVVEHLNRTVQGTLWEINVSNLDDIDK